MSKEHTHLDELPDTGSATKVSMALTMGLGVGGAVGFYLVLLPFMATGFGQLFFARGWVPFVLVFLMGWSFSILFIKMRKLKQQKRSFTYDLLPVELSEDISDGTVPFFKENIKKLPIAAQGNFLLTRILRGLSHFQARKNTAETASMLSSQSEIDATHVEASYTVLKVFIWAIPILGFIGTVMGISDAVGGFSGELQTAQDISVIKDKLGQVSGGLGVAFDTTLIALIMSLLVMFPASVMQMAEENLLNQIDDFCNENLVKRLDEGMHSRMGGEELHGDIAYAVQAALAGNDAALIHKLNEVQEQMGLLQENQAALLEGVSDSMVDAAEKLVGTFAGMEEGLNSLNAIVSQLGAEKVVVEQHYHSRGLFRRKK